MTRDVTGLQGAWAKRARDAAEILKHADAAPALFKPEYVQQVREDYATAIGWVGYWRAAS